MINKNKFIKQKRLLLLVYHRKREYRYTVVRKNIHYFVDTNSIEIICILF